MCDIKVPINDKKSPLLSKASQAIMAVRNECMTIPREVVITRVVVPRYKPRLLSCLTVYLIVDPVLGIFGRYVRAEL